MTEKNHRILCTRKVARTIRQSVFALLLSIIASWGVSHCFKVNHSDMTLTYLPNGNQILCAGLDDPEKLKSIVGISSCWHEEATELTPEDLLQLDLRLRDDTGNYKQHILTFNPISKTHHLRKRFVETVNDNALVLKTTYKDNAFIGQEYRDVLEGLKDQNPSAYQVYGLGEWGDLRGLIYPSIIVGDWSVSPEIEIYGLDFGFNNPTALVHVGIRDWNPESMRGDAYFREMLYESGLTNADLIARMNQLNLNPNAPIYADAAEPARIEELSRAGYWIIPCSKGKDSVHSGITFVQGFKLHTYNDSPNVIKEFSSYCWKMDKNDEPTEEPVKMWDHTPDAIRYAMSTHLTSLVGQAFEPYMIDPDTGGQVYL